MSKGILYVMTTVVPGLVKIGKTGSENFRDRMYNLERHGYSNVAGLKRRFAIEVDDYDEKEKLLAEIFSKSRVPNTELFALDIDVVIQLLSSLDGIQIYPEHQTKNEVFDQASKERKLKSDIGFLPDGLYFLNRHVKGFGEVSGKAAVKDGVFTLLKGSRCADEGPGFVSESRKNAPIENHVLQEDIICESPSQAGFIILGRTNNGWSEWKDADGNKIDTYRDKDKK